MLHLWVHVSILLHFKYTTLHAYSSVRAYYPPAPPFFPADACMSMLCTSAHARVHTRVYACTRARARAHTHTHSLSHTHARTHARTHAQTNTGGRRSQRSTTDRWCSSFMMRPPARILKKCPLLCFRMGTHWIHAFLRTLDPCLFKNKSCEGEILIF